MNTTTNFELVMMALTVRQDNDESLQQGLVGFIAELSALPKKDVVLNHELNAVFAHPAMARLHLRQVVTWVQAFTPIRVSFKDNGSFDKIKFAKKAEWDIEGLANAKWYEFEAVKTTAAQKANHDRALKALAKEAARLIHESGDALATLAALRNAVNSDKFNLLVVETMRSDSHAKWAEQRDADIEKAKAAAKPETKVVNVKADKLAAQLEAAA